MVGASLYLLDRRQKKSTRGLMTYEGVAAASKLPRRLVGFSHRSIGHLLGRIGVV
jgi:hypothetical protein